MAKWLTLSALLAVGACAGASGKGRESISGDIGVSHWVPPGQVDLELRSGSYRLRPARPRHSPAGTIVPIRAGRLAAEELRLVRDAFAAALVAGLTEAACEGGGTPPLIVVSTGPTPVMVLRSRGRTLVAPARQGCWTAAAQGLHSTLQAAFRWRSETRR